MNTESPLQSPLKKYTGVFVALISIAAATAVTLYVASRDDNYPTSDSAAIAAEVVHVAAVVGGRMTELHVVINQHVNKGDLLYVIDPEPYQLAVRQAEASVALSKASLADQQRMLAVRQAQAAIAHDQLNRAEKNNALADRTTARLEPLAKRAFIPWQQYDQARVTQNDTNISVIQARKQSEASDVAIGNLDTPTAAVAVNEAALAQARYQLRQTRIYAPESGYITSLTVKAGEVLAPSQVLFTLIVDDQWYAIANIRELYLRAIKPGDCATVYSMIDRSVPLEGRVASIGWGVMSGDGIDLSRSLPYIPRQMDWVHVAQRFPVRIKLVNPPSLLIRMGATASVEIRHGSSCH
ncbi:multidrug transporter subunit MdtN [Acetobacter thailandicus]|uniref:multidrug transporter subunit MdtN n=1 Tax=Acetobacter thailandicus TaxID=1502842 RepID=UPI001BA50987|nr:multidrug transporter subunit MdtN [Acetobacter thailandicus]MBS0980381.1 multidrug transporter subunit MdtN [Acetobacter thailandicus]